MLVDPVYVLEAIVELTTDYILEYHVNSSVVLEGPIEMTNKRMRVLRERRESIQLRL